MTKISIILPIYNGEKYLEYTIKSLLEQTFSDFEIICIDDSSTDNSLNILREYASIDDRIKIYTKKNEGSASKSIKFGLQFVSGEYFMYTSQDDFFSIDLLNKNYQKAKETHSDAILPDLVFYSEQSQRRQIGIHSNRNVVLTGAEAFNYSLNWEIHGFALWKTSLIKENFKSDDLMVSDEYTYRICFLRSRKVAFSDGTFYYRVNNPNAITKKWNIKLFDYISMHERLFTIIKHYNLASNIYENNAGALIFNLLYVYKIFTNSSNIPMENRQNINILFNQYYTKHRKFIKYAIRISSIDRFLLYHIPSLYKLKVRIKRYL